MQQWLTAITHCACRFCKPDISVAQSSGSTRKTLVLTSTLTRLQMHSMLHHDSAVVDALLAGLPRCAQAGGCAAHHHQHVDRLKHEPAWGRFTPSACTLSPMRGQSDVSYAAPSSPADAAWGDSDLDGRLIPPLSLRAPTAHLHHKPGSLRYSWCHDQSAERGLTADSSTRRPPSFDQSQRQS